MGKNLRIRITRAAIRAWLPVIGLGGAGLLPCPDCGAPMILHFWPVALVLALRNLRRSKVARDQAPPAEVQSSVSIAVDVSPSDAVSSGSRSYNHAGDSTTSVEIKRTENGNLGDGFP